MPTTQTKPPKLNVCEKDILWYIKEICGGEEKFEFGTQAETDEFGKKLRESSKHGNIKVDISYLTVRVKILD